MQEKNNIISYKGYSAEIQFSSEDECLIGHILNINDIVGFHGNSVDEIKNAFAEAVDFYIKTNIDDTTIPIFPTKYINVYWLSFDIIKSY